MRDGGAEPDPALRENPGCAAGHVVGGGAWSVPGPPPAAGSGWMRSSGLWCVPASSPPERVPASLSPPETAVAPEGVGGRSVWPVRSWEPKPLEPWDEPFALLQAAVHVHVPREGGSGGVELEKSAEGKQAPPGREWNDLAPRSDPGKEDEPAAELVLGCDAGAGGWLSPRWRAGSAAALVEEEASRLRLGEEGLGLGERAWVGLGLGLGLGIGLG